MDEIEELIDQLREDGQDVWVAGPQSRQAIAELEKALGVTLPPSYRQFLSRIGEFKLLNSSVSGIVDGKPLADDTGGMYIHTQRYRLENDLPEHLLVIQPDEDAPYCLDASAADEDGEMPVVCYELDSGHTERMASSFDEWFLEYLQLQADEDA
jgi:SMI1-KNR4 cell-wall